MVSLSSAEQTGESLPPSPETSSSEPVACGALKDAGRAVDTVDTVAADATAAKAGAMADMATNVMAGTATRVNLIFPLRYIWRQARGLLPHRYVLG
jgi:hypothetical protein